MFKVPPDKIQAWVEANFEVKPRKNGSELRICNPLNGDTGFHFNISIHKATCHDWRGDDWVGKYKPTFLRFVQLYRKCSYAQAIQEICGKGVTLKSIELELRRSRNEREEEQNVEVLLELPSGSQKLIGSSQPKMASMLISWLETRGIDRDRIEQYDLHHVADTVVWPYYEYGMLVYWQSRNRLNKVFNFPHESVGVGKTDFLYGFDMIEPNEYVAITEAIFGATTLNEQALASGGAVLEAKQIRKLRVFNPVRGVILAPDNDKAGIGSIPRNYDLIRSYYPVFHSVPPKLEYTHRGEKCVTKDWNELYTGMNMSLQQVRQVFEKNITRTTFQHISNFVKFATAA